MISNVFRFFFNNGQKDHVQALNRYFGLGNHVQPYVHQGPHSDLPNLHNITKLAALLDHHINWHTHITNKQFSCITHDFIMYHTIKGIDQYNNRWEYHYELGNCHSMRLNDSLSLFWDKNKQELDAHEYTLQFLITMQSNKYNHV